MKARMIACVLMGFALLFCVGCKDDTDDGGSNTPASENACDSACNKAVECSFYSSQSECVTNCTSNFSSGELSCINSCNSSATCQVWEGCAGGCFEDVEGNGEYCEGYVMGSDDDECCQTNNPCDWAADDFCDCGGSCTWDAADCK